MPAFYSSVALLRKSPYCSYRWHTRQTTLSYKARQKNAPFHPALRYPSPPRPSSRLIVLWGGAFFHLIDFDHLILPPSRHLIVSRLVSSPVPNIAGRRRLVLFLVPASYRMKQGVGRLSVLSHHARAVAISSSCPISSRLARRLGPSCCRASRVISSDDGQARRQGRLVIGLIRPVPSSVRRASRRLPDPRGVTVAPSSPHPLIHGKQAAGGITEAAS